MQMYSFFDTVGDEFLPIWLAKNDKQAKQIVDRSRKDNGDKVAYGDLRLFCLGDFNTETGVVSAVVPLREVVFLSAEDN